MKRIGKILLLLLWLGAGIEVTLAQTTPITAPSGSITMGGLPITTGVATFIPVDVNGHPIAVTKSTGGLNLPGSATNPVGYSCPIVAGGLASCVLPDEVLSSPHGFAYNVTISDTSTGGPTSGDSFSLYQVGGISGASYNLSTYTGAASVSIAAAFTFTHAPGAPSGACVEPAFYTNDTTGGLSQCVNGAWVAVVGGGGGAGVSSIDTLTGAFTFGGAGVNHVGNAYTFTGGGTTGTSTAKSTNSPLTLADDFRTIENFTLSNNLTTFSDGTNFVKAAGTSAAYANFYISDNVLSAMQYPAFFTPATELSWARKEIAAQNYLYTGQLPWTLSSTGAVVTSPDAFTVGGSLTSYIGDGWIFTPIAEWLYWNGTGDITKFTADATAIESAMAGIPIDGVNGLVKITPGSEWIPWLYLEIFHPTGDVADGSVWYAYDARLLAQMYTAAGNTAKATYWTGIYNTVTASIASTISNSTNGMLYMGTTQSHQIDIVSSALAVYLELLPAAQETLISRYLVTNIAPGASTPYSPLVSYPLAAVVSSGGNFYTSAISSNLGNALTNTTDWTLTPAYVAGTTYGLGAAVSYGGGVYTSLAAGNVGNTPASSSTFWSQFVSNGFVRNSPVDANPLGCTNTGGSPYTYTPCGLTTNGYQNAWWAYGNGFIEYAMAKTNLAAAKQLAQAQRISADPAQEYILKDGTAAGNTPNSSSPAGSLIFTQSNNASTYFPVNGVCFATLYGVCSQSTPVTLGGATSVPGSGCLLNGITTFYGDGSQTICVNKTLAVSVAVPTAATYLATTFTEGAAAANLAGTIPATCTAGTAGANGCTWTLASGVDFKYSGSSSVTAATQTFSDLINTGQANETIRFNVSACSGTASVCQIQARFTNTTNFIAINLSPTAGSISVADVVANVATTAGSIPGPITGAYTVAISGTTVTITAPGGSLSFTTGTPAGTYFGMLDGATSMTLTSLTAKSF